MWEIVSKYFHFLINYIILFNDAIKFYSTFSQLKKNVSAYLFVYMCIYVYMDSDWICLLLTMSFKDGKIFLLASSEFDELVYVDCK